MPVSDDPIASVGATRHLLNGCVHVDRVAGDRILGAQSCPQWVEFPGPDLVEDQLPAACGRTPRQASTCDVLLGQGPGPRAPESCRRLWRSRDACLHSVRHSTARLADGAHGKGMTPWC